MIRPRTIALRTIAVPAMATPSLATERIVRRGYGTDSIREAILQALEVVPSRVEAQDP